MPNLKDIAFIGRKNVQFRSSATSRLTLLTLVVPQSSPSRTTPKFPRRPRQSILALLPLLPRLLSAATVTVFLTFVCGAFGLLVAVPVGVARLSSWPWLRRLSGEYGDASLNYRHNGRIGSTVGIKLGSHGEHMYIARRNPKAPVIVSGNREKRLTSCNLDHPLAAGVSNRNG